MCNKTAALYCKGKIIVFVVQNKNSNINSVKNFFS